MSLNGTTPLPLSLAAEFHVFLPLEQAEVALRGSNNCALRDTLGLLDAALVEMDHALGTLSGARVVRHHQDGLPELGVEPPHEIQDLPR